MGMCSDICVIVSKNSCRRVVLRGCGKLRGSTVSRCNFLRPLNLIKTCMFVYVCVNLSVCLSVCLSTQTVSVSAAYMFVICQYLLTDNMMQLGVTLKCLNLSNI